MNFQGLTPRVAEDWGEAKEMGCRRAHRAPFLTSADCD
jgi:hypothetical protein